MIAARRRLPFEEAVRLRGRLGENHWELAQARERLGEALLGSGDVAAARPLLAQAVTTFARELGADHVETVRARRALARASG